MAVGRLTEGEGSLWNCRWLPDASADSSSSDTSPSSCFSYQLSVTFLLSLLAPPQVFFPFSIWLDSYQPMLNRSLLQSRLEGCKEQKLDV